MDSPREFGNGVFGKIQNRELPCDPSIDSHSRLADIEPDADADQDAEQGVAPVNQEHQHKLDGELKRIEQ